MATKSKRAKNDRRSHDRSATIQWVAICLIGLLLLIAAFTLSDGGSALS